MDQLIPSLAELVESFRDCFHPSVFPTFQALLAGWIVCLGPRTLSEVWQATGWAAKRHHDTAYAVFHSAAWEWDDLGLVLATLILAHLVPGGVVWIVVDDTLCHKRGAKVAFGGIFLDAVLSTKRHKTLRFGLNWVVLGIAVPLPFREDRYFCLPMLWRLYRKKGISGHQTRPLAAAELARKLAEANPGRSFWLVGDSLAEGPEVVLHAELFFQAAESTVDRVLRPRLALGIAQQHSVQALLAEPAHDLHRPVGPQGDHSVALLSFRLPRGKDDAAALQVDVPRLDLDELLRPGSRFPGHFQQRAEIRLGRRLHDLGILGGVDRQLPRLAARLANPGQRVVRNQPLALRPVESPLHGGGEIVLRVRVPLLRVCVHRACDMVGFHRGIKKRCRNGIHECLQPAPIRLIREALAVLLRPVEKQVDDLCGGDVACPWRQLGFLRLPAHQAHGRG